MFRGLLADRDRDVGLGRTDFLGAMDRSFDLSDAPPVRGIPADMNVTETCQELGKLLLMDGFATMSRRSAFSRLLIGCYRFNVHGLLPEHAVTELTSHSQAPTWSKRTGRPSSSGG